MTMNHAIQANYNILKILEKSKVNSEKIINLSTDLFYLVDRKGTIFFINNQAARFANLEESQCLGKSFYKFFSNKNAQLLKRKIDESVSGEQFFESIVDDADGEKVYSWCVKSFGEFSNYKLNLFLVEGRNVTEKKKYEKYSNYFSLIPIGFMVLDSNLIIQSDIPEHTTQLLGIRNIVGKSLPDILFKPSESEMNRSTLDSIKAFCEATKLSHEEFIIFSEIFPKKIPYVIYENDTKIVKTFGFKVSPIFDRGKLANLLIFLEDISVAENYKITQDNLSENAENNKNFKRYSQIKFMSEEIFLATYSDFEKHFINITEALRNRDRSLFLSTLHTIKSGARLLGLQDLQDNVQKTEDTLKESFSWDKALDYMNPVFTEWYEIQNIKKVIYDANSSKDHSKSSYAITNLDNSIWNLYKNSKSDRVKTSEFEKYLKEISKSNLGKIESTLVELAQKTSVTLGKLIKLEFLWNKNDQIDIDLLKDIKTCLVHILNNAIDHGIQLPEDRLQANKNSFGVIRINFHASLNGVIIFIEDDGRGINRDKITDRLVKTKNMARDYLDTFTDEQIFNYLFEEGFSTRNKADSISGAGVGLSAVKFLTEQHSGTAQITSKLNEGTKIELFFSTSDKKINLNYDEIEIQDTEINFKTLVNIMDNVSTTSKSIVDLTRTKTSTVEKSIISEIILAMANRSPELIIMHNPLLNNIFSEMVHPNLILISKMPAFTKLGSHLSNDLLLKKLSRTYLDATNLFDQMDHETSEVVKNLAGSKVEVDFNGALFNFCVYSDQSTLQTRFEETYAPFLEPINYSGLCAEFLNMMVASFKEPLRESGYSVKFGIPHEIQAGEKVDVQVLSEWSSRNKKEKFYFKLTKG